MVLMSAKSIRVLVKQHDLVNDSALSVGLMKAKRIFFEYAGITSVPLSNSSCTNIYPTDVQCQELHIY